MGGMASRFQIAQIALKEIAIGQHGDRRCTAGFVFARNLGGVKVFRKQSSAGRSFFDLRNDGWRAGCNRLPKRTPGMGMGPVFQVPQKNIFGLELFLLAPDYASEDVILSQLLAYQDRRVAGLRVSSFRLEGI